GCAGVPPVCRRVPPGVPPGVPPVCRPGVPPGVPPGVLPGCLLGFSASGQQVARLLSAPSSIACSSLRSPLPSMTRGGESEGEFSKDKLFEAAWQSRLGAG
uniref:PCOTH protein n=1 Tax=Macrostomum lignano TaxID=282301 RepID=A0A1I8J9T1_9PLAT